MHQARMPVRESDDLGLKLTMVSDERLHRLKRAVVASDGTLGFGVQFLGVQMHHAHLVPPTVVDRRGAESALSRP